MPHAWDPTTPPPEAALQRLLQGNRRFIEQGGTATRHALRVDLAEQGQRPFAVILGCSDSRTPVEILFDQGFGDLFVVRVAGNVVAPSIVGSVEFACSQFGTRLVLVLGHTRCGAISASIRALDERRGHESQNIQAITNRISPHLRELVQLSPIEEHQSCAFLREAMHANVRASVAHLQTGSQLLEELVLAGRVRVVGAEYEIETGRVHLLDD